MNPFVVLISNLLQTSRFSICHYPRPPDHYPLFLISPTPKAC